MSSAGPWTRGRVAALAIALCVSYDGITDARQTAPDYLSIVGRGAFATAPATPAGSR